MVDCCGIATLAVVSGYLTWVMLRMTTHFIASKSNVNGMALEMPLAWSVLKSSIWRAQLRLRNDAQSEM